MRRRDASEEELHVFEDRALQLSSLAALAGAPQVPAVVALLAHHQFLSAKGPLAAPGCITDRTRPERLHCSAACLKQITIPALSPGNGFLSQVVIPVPIPGRPPLSVGLLGLPKSDMRLLHIAGRLAPLLVRLAERAAHDFERQQQQVGFLSAISAAGWVYSNRTSEINVGAVHWDINPGFSMV